MRILSDYLQQINQAQTLNELDTLFQSIVNELHCHEFTYTFYSKDFNTSKILQHEYASDYLKKWHEHFVEKDYESVDSIGRKVRTSVVPVVWDLRMEHERARATEKQMFKEALDYGLITGVSIPIYNAKGEVAILVMHSKDITKKLSKHPEQLAILHHLALYYHQKVMELLGVSNDPMDFSLTKREIECLQLTAHSKSPQEIADLLKISTRTVGFHIENANKKLHTKNKYQSIVKALSLELLEL